MSRDEYIRTLRWLWSHSEGDIEPAGIEIMFTRHKGNALSIENFLTHQESLIFSSWPEVITIYRGGTEETSAGLSWSERRAIAEGFARQRARESPAHNGIVLTGQCNKHDILCYILNDMNEYEVLVRPERVRIVSRETI